MMDLQSLWFILIAVLFIGYFFLEGFDFGVGMLLPILGRNDTEKRVILNSIGPFWDANEVWIITAAGAMFAAFPDWYATLFSGFYLPMFLILVGLIVRIAGIEFRGKVHSPAKRDLCDLMIFLGSFLPAFMWGLIITNIVRGLPIDASKNMVGGLDVIFHPYALLGGLVAVVVFILHGALFLSLRTTDPLRLRAHKAAERFWLPAGLLLAVFAWLGRSQTHLFDGMGLVPGTLPLLAILCFLFIPIALRIKNDALAFISGSAMILFATVVAFEGLYPNVMPSTLGEALSLTIRNASSSDYTLKVMTVVALTLLPFVLGYQIYTYWVFRKRVTPQTLDGGY
ncbi:cytochrome d ubiquinol oxidase subunit II [Deinococcus cellulosilyticus]|uniref:Cytochrome c oxidase assembly protein n=1 Tax=Deinococcus cellulosilyticus (strain DSM 18568 / NBRC 106333 / KACC 11606 / 5516J-15) TaxID=1223518 RepID=A0A511N903_DEIC1|nr:cytochrome d ubiquinol oxidase subunit II [Deinococcus cellulosilyticus]GEM49329.1 cytochrome c oxidase assembly protein [Deinococcus cellulosilyticus NBRC 106333 = KACC 11606]